MLVLQYRHFQLSEGKSRNIKLAQDITINILQSKIL